MEKADVVVVSSKGQVVIPQDIRQKLRIGAKSKLLVYQYEDALIMKKLEVEGVEKSRESRSRWRRFTGGSAPGRRSSGNSERQR